MAVSCIPSHRQRTPGALSFLSPRFADVSFFPCRNKARPGPFCRNALLILVFPSPGRRERNNPSFFPNWGGSFSPLSPRTIIPPLFVCFFSLSTMLVKNFPNPSLLSLPKQKKKTEPSLPFFYGGSVSVSDGFQDVTFASLFLFSSPGIVSLSSVVHFFSSQS